MRPFTVAGFCTIALAVFVPSAQAQTCLGGPSISKARSTQAGVGVAFRDELFAFGGNISAGNDSAFGGLTVSRRSLEVDGFDSLSAVNLAVNAGLQIPATPDKRAMFCPIVGFSRTFGPNDVFDSGLDLSDWSIGGGGAFGVTVGAPGSIQFVPTVSLQVVRTTVTAKFGGESESESDTNGVLTLGLGFLLNERVSVLPNVSIPIGVEDGKALFGLSVIFSFGK